MAIFISRSTEYGSCDSSDLIKAAISLVPGNIAVMLKPTVIDNGMANSPTQKELVSGQKMSSHGNGNDYGRGTHQLCYTGTSIRRKVLSHTRGNRASDPKDLS